MLSSSFPSFVCFPSKESFFEKKVLLSSIQILLNQNILIILYNKNQALAVEMDVYLSEKPRENFIKEAILLVGVNIQQGGMKDWGILIPNRGMQFGRLFQLIWWEFSDQL